MKTLKKLFIVVCFVGFLVGAVSITPITVSADCGLDGEVYPDPFFCEI